MSNVIQFWEMYLHAQRTWKLGRRLYNGGGVLSRKTKEKDLEVIFSADMKVSDQCRIAASTAQIKF